ncbi:MAG TPA: helix-turn-helix domain-containing protein [Mycobacterium sp.]|nr:helix-turn-helix domain-containing protein [Mycobacterium sp.]
MPEQNPLDAQRVGGCDGAVTSTPKFETQNIDDWSGALVETYGAMGVVPEGDGPFSASLSRRDFDRLKTVSLRGTPQTFHRTTPMIKRDSANEMILTMVVEGSGMLIQDARTAPLRPGEFTLLENVRPYTMVLHEPARLIDFTWPRELIALSESESHEVTARTISSDAPMGRLLAPMLLDLYRMDGGLSSSGAVRLSRGIADLLVTAVLELSRPDSAGPRSRHQYDEVIRFIQRNLEDPALSAESIAEAFFFSPRTVHRVFARHGTTAAAVIRDMRLDACRQMMLSPTSRDKSISFIASQFGFSSLQVFSRAFTAHYGTAPKAYRNLHQ